MHRYALLGSALVVLIASGVVHGLWTDRWSSQEDLTEAAERLVRLPLDIGTWHGEDIPQTESAPAGLAATVVRRYVNTTDGKAVTLYLACGRPGPASVHTPDVCYPGSGFDADKKSRFQLPGQGGTDASEFWTARFVRERKDGRTPLRIFWGWLTSAGWKADENPRLAFAGERVLHKMYLIRELTTSDEPLDGDAAVAFMNDLLPELGRTLYRAPR